MNRTVPPFYSNREDNKSCSLATYRALIEHFTHTSISWTDVEQLHGYTPDAAAWTLKALLSMSDKGWDIVVHEPFDYELYLEKGENYLRAQMGDEIAEWQLAHSNIAEIKQYIPDYTKKIKHYVKNPTIATVEQMIDDGRLVTLVLNSRVLNGKSGYVGHSVLIFDYDENSFKFHDPGLPPHKSRIESKELILRAMGNASDATGFKLK